MKHAIDKAGVSWVKEVKKLQWKVIAEVVSDRDVFILSYQQDLCSMLIIHNPLISQSRPFIRINIH